MTVTIVEDENLFRDFLVNLCEPLFDKVQAVSNATELRQQASIFQETDLAVIDVVLDEGVDGVELAQNWLKEKPSLRVLIVSSATDKLTLHRVYQSGVHGYVDKANQPLHVLESALKSLQMGKPFFTETAVEIKQQLQRDPNSFLKILSDTEIELLPLLSRGLSNDEISEQTGTKPLTIQWHRRNIMRKLEIHATPQLMRWGFENGFWKRAS